MAGLLRMRTRSTVTFECEYEQRGLARARARDIDRLEPRSHTDHHTIAIDHIIYLRRLRAAER